MIRSRSFLLEYAHRYAARAYVARTKADHALAEHLSALAALAFWHAERQPESVRG